MANLIITSRSMLISIGPWIVKEETRILGKIKIQTPNTNQMQLNAWAVDQAMQITLG